jgi:chemotaxis protein CheZ
MYGGAQMVVQRKRYRIEEAIGIDVPVVVEEVSGGEVGPMHREIMAELRAIRAQMARRKRKQERSGRRG